MKTILLVAGGLLVGCASAPPAHFPRTFASETQDAWLTVHCDARPLLHTTAHTFDADMAKQNANFAEILSADERPNRFTGEQRFVVKPFRCATRPSWYVADTADVPSDL